MFEYPLGFRKFHDNPSINYQLNRWLPVALEGELAETAKKINTLADCKPNFLKLAERAEKEGRVQHAATYYHGAEFFMPFDDKDKLDAYDRFRKLQYESTEYLGYERLEVPFQGGKLPVLKFNAKGKVLDRLLIHGGFDSYMEEFMYWGPEFSDMGIEVYFFEGPGQGSALRHSNLKMSPEWEIPVSSILDHLELDSCSIFGISLGGYLALRAAAFEPRIKRVMLINVLLDFLGCFLDKAPENIANAIQNFLINEDRNGMNKLAEQLSTEPSTAWAIDHGKHVCGAKDSYDYFMWLKQMNTESFSQTITQPCLVTAGTTDHIVPVEQFFHQLKLLNNSSALTARLFTEVEHASAHCQVGNLRLLLEVVKNWLKFDYTHK